MECRSRWKEGADSGGDGQLVVGFDGWKENVEMGGYSQVSADEKTLLREIYFIIGGKGFHTLHEGLHNRLHGALHRA